MLAEAGAEVIKVVKLGGENMRRFQPNSRSALLLGLWVYSRFFNGCPPTFQTTMKCWGSGWLYPMGLLRSSLFPKSGPITDLPEQNQEISILDATTMTRSGQAVWTREVLGSCDHPESFGQDGRGVGRLVAWVDELGRSRKAFVEDHLR